MSTKASLLLLSIAAFVWSCSNAQTKNENTPETDSTVVANPDDSAEERLADYDEEECEEFEGVDCNCGEGEDSYPVKFSGKQPTILDFANAMISSEDFAGEGIGTFLSIIDDYQKGKKPEYGELTVDKANGYISYIVDWSKYDSDTQEVSTDEMCYWNCKDGRHKILAINIKVRQGKRYVDTECTGCNFLCYDNETRTMEWNSADQLGALVTAPLMCWPPQDPDDYNLSAEDYWRYSPIYELPRYGKNIKLHLADSTLPASKHRTCELVWNGEGFTKQFSK